MGRLQKIKSRMNKRGAIDPGNVATKFMLTIFGLTVLGFLVIVVAGTLKTASDDSMPSDSTIIVNETFGPFNASATSPVLLKAIALGNCSATCGTLTILNATGFILGTSNFTTSSGGCGILAVDDIEPSPNNSNLEASYTLSTKDCSARDMLSDVSSGISGFYSNVSTWFNILSVVIIIGLIILVWSMARSTGAGGGGGRRSSGSASDFA